jgi:predicted nuclease of predicted toxin-antitoxin system
MLRLVADENFNNNIVRAILRRKVNIDIVRVQEVVLSGADDPTVLEWAAQQRRILLTHDVSTIVLVLKTNQPPNTTLLQQRFLQLVGAATYPIIGGDCANPQLSLRGLILVLTRHFSLFSG